MSDNFILSFAKYSKYGMNRIENNGANELNFYE